MDDNLKAALAEAVEKIIPANKPRVEMPEVRGPKTHDRMPTLVAPKVDERMQVIAPDTTGDKIEAKPRNELPENVKNFAQGLAKSGTEITDLAPKGPSAPLNTAILPSPVEARDR